MLVVDTDLNVLVALPMTEGSRIMPILNTDIVKNETAKIIMIMDSDEPAIWKGLEFVKGQLVPGFIYYWTQKQELVRFKENTKLYLLGKLMPAQKYNERKDKWQFSIAPTECVEWLKSQLGYCRGY
jgi:hypothetical protein